MDMGRSIRVYVYDLRGKDFAADPAEFAVYSFDRTFRQLLSSSHLHRESDPRRADYFYVPVDLCSLRAHWWGRKDKKEHMNLLDQRVVETMRAVGPYWDRHPERHIVPACRCPTSPSRVDELNPQLWGRNSTLHLCLETRVTKKNETADVDRRRSLHIGYHVPTLNIQMPELPAVRDIFAIYMGAPINKYRKQVAAWMNESCKDCALFELAEHTNLKEDEAALYHAALRRARFSIEPPGDTLERMSREASILSGAIPVIFDLPSGMPQQFLPWTPLLNWSDFSVSFALTEEEARGDQSFAPRLEALLRSLVESGEADRLSRGVASARSSIRWREDGALATVMGMLAWRKAGMPEEPRRAPHPNWTKSQVV